MHDSCPQAEGGSMTRLECPMLFVLISLLSYREEMYSVPAEGRVIIRVDEERGGIEEGYVEGVEG